MLELLKLGRSMLNVGNVSLIGYAYETHKCLYNNYSWSKRTCSPKNCGLDSETNNKVQRKKTIRVPKVTLMHPNKSITVETLEAAEKLAKRRNLELVQVCDLDPKSGRSIYKLLSSTEYLQDERNDSRSEEPHSTKKKRVVTKKFNIKCQIGYNDLNTKINNINTLLEKGCAIKIIVTNMDGKEEKIVERLKNSIRGTISLEKREKVVTALTFSPLSSDSSSQCEV